MIIVMFKCLKMKIKYLNTSTVIYSDLECLFEKTNNNNDQNKSKIKINKRTPCGYSMYTQCSFYNTKNKLDHYRGEDWMKKFADCLKDHISIIIDYEQKKINKTH